MATSCGFESHYRHQKRSNFCLPKVTSFFIQATGLAYHHRAKRGAYHQGRQADLASHHALACITLRLDDIQHFVLMICNSFGIDDIQGCALICLHKSGIIPLKGVFLCQNIKAASNTLSQIRKSSISVYANIREANYGQSKADMLSKFEIALKECSETEGWLQLLFNTNAIDEETYKKYRNLCGRIRRMLIASCKTLKEDV